MTPTPSTLSTCSLSAGYDNKVIVRDLNLELEPGTMVVLLGANGRGKSTLLRTLSGAQPPLAGTVTIEGKPVDRIAPTEMAKLISLVYTDRTHSAQLTAAELVGLGRQPYTGFFGRLSDNDRLIVNDALDTVGMLSMATRQINTLSDGERQKIMLARALAQETPVILLDEPTSFLDIASRIETMQLLHDLAVIRGKTILLSTHDIAEALPLATHAWLMIKNPDDSPSAAATTMITGSITTLIANGSFDRLFPDRKITFDPASFTFRPDK